MEVLKRMNMNNKGKRNMYPIHICIFGVLSLPCKLGHVLLAANLQICHVVFHATHKPKLSEDYLHIKWLFRSIGHFKSIINV
jgi:hypothetical protein